MLSKNEVKYIQSLCHKKQRQEEGLFIAEGPKLINEILNSHYQVQQLYATPEWISKNKAIKQVLEVTADELARISQLQTPNQVLALVKMKAAAEPDIKNQLALVLDGIQDPGNLGTIIRIADWFGITHIICSADTAELYNPKVIQATMGSFVRTHVWYVDLVTFLTQQKFATVYGTLLNGASIYQVEQPKAGLLIIGNEGKGIRDELMTFITHPITIPKIGGAESLNAAVATGIVLSYLRGG